MDLKSCLSKKVILFDLDGTITDPKIGITKSVQYALKAFGIYEKNLDDLCRFIGPPLKESFMNFYGFSETKAEEAVEKYREYFKDTGIYENVLYSEMKALLAKLTQGGKQLIIATSKPKVFAHRILEYFNIEKYFQFVSGSELDGTRTRKSEVIQYALEQNNIKDLVSVIMIGDREHDIIGAKTIGIDSIGVLYGYGSYEELERAGADFIVKNIDELGQLLT